jgi:hypothetical protein
MGILVWQPGDVLGGFYPFTPARRISPVIGNTVYFIHPMGSLALRIRAPFYYEGFTRLINQSND